MRYHEIFPKASLSITEAVGPGEGPAITTAESGGNLPFIELRKRVQDMMRNWQQQKRIFHNVDANINIYVSRTSIGKSPMVGERLLRLHYALPYILEQGKLTKEAPSNKPQQTSLEAILVFSAEVSLDGAPFKVIALVKRQNSGAHFHYSLHDMVVGSGAPSA